MPAKTKVTSFNTSGFGSKWYSGTGVSGTGSSVTYRRVNNGISSESIEELEQLAYALEIGSGGILSIPFRYDNIGTEQTNVQMLSPSGLATSVTMPFRGSLLALGFSGTAAKSAGVMTVTLFIDGVATTAIATVPSQRYYTAKFNKGSYGWSADSEIDLRITTDGSYAPTTNDWEAIAYVTLEQSEVQ
jgi:hypothetical protein